jgi:RNA methyltransferase, TrmH family
MLSKTQNKYIRSLTQQKYRKEHNVFVAEGDKIATEWLMSDHSIQMIVAVQEWLDANKAFVKLHKEAEVCVVSEAELDAISALHTPNRVLLVVNMPSATYAPAPDSWCIVLDGIQDPGNMGTIIRTADWFGIPYIVCSPDCVDVYNSKVVQSAMGSHLRVQICEQQLVPFLQTTTLPVIAASLYGENIYEVSGIEKGIIVIGSEGKGISADVLKLATHQVTIPKLGGAESLNAAVATGIFCALLLRS